MTEKATEQPNMTGKEVLDFLRISTNAPRVSLHALRARGLRAVRRGKEFIYDRADVMAFCEALKTEGYVRVTQAALGLRLNPQWLGKQIEDGKLPGVVTAAGQILCDPRRIREAMREQDAQERLERAKRQRGEA